MGGFELVTGKNQWEHVRADGVKTIKSLKVSSDCLFFFVCLFLRLPFEFSWGGGGDVIVVGEFKMRRSVLCGCDSIPVKGPPV